MLFSSGNSSILGMVWEITVVEVYKGAVSISYTCS